MEPFNSAAFSLGLETGCHGYSGFLQLMGGSSVAWHPGDPPGWNMKWRLVGVVVEAGSQRSRGPLPAELKQIGFQVTFIWQSIFSWKKNRPFCPLPYCTKRISVSLKRLQAHHRAVCAIIRCSGMGLRRVFFNVSFEGKKIVYLGSEICPFKNKYAQ